MFWVPEKLSNTRPAPRHMSRRRSNCCVGHITACDNCSHSEHSKYLKNKIEINPQLVNTFACNNGSVPTNTDAGTNKCIQVSYAQYTLLPRLQFLSDFLLSEYLFYHYTGSTVHCAMPHSFICCHYTGSTVQNRSPDNNKWLKICPRQSSVEATAASRKFVCILKVKM